MNVLTGNLFLSRQASIFSTKELNNKVLTAAARFSANLGVAEKYTLGKVMLPQIPQAPPPAFVTSQYINIGRPLFWSLSSKLNERTDLHRLVELVG